MGSLEAAEKDFDSAIRRSTKPSEAYLNRGKTWFKLGEIDKSIIDIDSAIYLNKKVSEAYYLKGILLSRISRPIEALDNLFIADYLDEDRKEYISLIAQLVFSLGRYGEASKYLSRSIVLDPNNWDLYFKRGKCQSHLQNPNGAIDDYLKAILLDTSRYMIYGDIADENMHLGRYKEGISDYDSIIKRNPAMENAYEGQGVLYDLLGQYDSAIKRMEKANSLAGINPDFDFNYGWTLIHKSRYKEAIQALNHAVMYKFNYAAAYTSRGYANFKIGNDSLAIRDYDLGIACGGPGYISPFEYKNEAVANLNRKNNEYRNSPLISVSWVNPFFISDTSFEYKGTDTPEFHLRIVSNRRINANNISIETAGSVINRYPNCRILDNVSEGEYIYDIFPNLEFVEGKSSLKVKCELDEYKKYSTPIVFYYKPSHLRLHVIAVGIPGEDLIYPEKDARDFVSLFETQDGNRKLYDSVKTTVLTGNRATSNKIIDELTKLAKDHLNDSDIVILFFSCHAFIHKNTLRLRSADYDPVRSEKTSVNFDEEILRPLLNINCKKIIFIDACHSGGGWGAKGDSAEGINNAIEEITKFNNGIAIFASCKEEQVSWEDKKWENGAFTFAIKDALMTGMKDVSGKSIIRLNDFGNYIQKKVAEIVQEVKKKKQMPYCSNPIGNMPFYIFGK